MEYCDKRGCTNPVDVMWCVAAVVECECGKRYARCAEHGGIEAAKRSLRSHKGLSHFQRAD